MRCGRRHPSGAVLRFCPAKLKRHEPLVCANLIGDEWRELGDDWEDFLPASSVEARAAADGGLSQAIIEASERANTPELTLLVSTWKDKGWKLAAAATAGAGAGAGAAACESAAVQQCSSFC